MLINTELFPFPKNNTNYTYIYTHTHKYTHIPTHLIQHKHKVIIMNMNKMFSVYVCNRIHTHTCRHNIFIIKYCNFLFSVYQRFFLCTTICVSVCVCVILTNNNFSPLTLSIISTNKEGLLKNLKLNYQNLKQKKKRNLKM